MWLFFDFSNMISILLTYWADCTTGVDW